MRTALSLPHRHLTSLLLSSILFLCTARVAAATPYISEVMPAPTTGNEWVELHNPHDTSAWLMGWSLEDSTSVLVPAPAFDDTTIPAGGYVIFEVKNKLNNGGDSLTLKNMMGGTVDTFIYTSSNSTQSWARQPSTAVGSFQLSTPTPGSANDASPLPSPSPTPSAIPSSTPAPSPSASPTPLPSPTPTATQSALLLSTPSPLPLPTPTPPPNLTLHVSEINACPTTGNDEWVELYNPQPQPIILENWKLKDAFGNTRTFSLTLARESYALVEIPSALLNNSGDTLSILDQSGKELIFLTLPACAQGQSTVFSTTGWQQTLTPTPLGENTLSVLSPASSPTVSLTTTTTADQSATSNQASSTTQWSALSSSSGSTDQDALNSLTQFTNDLQQELLSESDGHDTRASEQSLHVLPSLTVQPMTDVTPSPVPSALATINEGGGQPPQIDSGLPLWAQRLGIATLLSCALGCFAVSGYLLWQWYTEHHVEAAVEIL